MGDLKSELLGTPADDKTRGQVEETPSPEKRLLSMGKIWGMEMSSRGALDDCEVGINLAHI